jgi:hypothetical protein
MDHYELGVALAVAHLAELHRQADRRRLASRIPGRTADRRRDRAPGSSRALGRHGQAADRAVAAGGPGRGTEAAAMLVGHQHKPGLFDAGHCRACAHQAGLLDHYWQVQQQEAALRQAHGWARAARRRASVALWSVVRHRDPAGRRRRADRMSRPPAAAGPAEPARYELRVQGVLDDRWSAWFEGLRIASDQHGQTTITGPVADQAALHGLLAKIRDLGLPLLSVRRLDPDC